MVNPGAGETFWSQQPMFVLRGSVAEIALRPAGEPTALWTARFPLAPIQTVAVQYDGVPLTPGADYEWVLYQRQRDRSLKDVLTVPFRIMETGEERDRIATDLATFQTQGTAEGADADAGYFGFGAQVTYLFYSGLPADAFQALFSVSEPTAEFVASREALVTAICPPLDN
ncbi:hypothetical protein [Leptolyngbya sp. PCC 6406]|uniref:hypothetical protein n=1 Tax=Leptolyngbya sp. PCC 6406 TaxID=1173264 RepID=UPI0002D3FCAC|nr:hypothetical protein [Leptolyngbya sp. PCC 6406]